MRGTTFRQLGNEWRHTISTHVPMRGTTPRSITIDGAIFISTHVPMRGTTAPPAACNPRGGISTHVPMRGTTTPMYLLMRHFLHFNPRPHAGDDDNSIASASLPTISTHVPMRGTTRARNSSARLTSISTHVPMRGTTRYGVYLPCPTLTHVPMRGTTVNGLSHGRHPLFQPTSPCGGRLVGAEVEIPQADFNPRPHAGDDSRRFNDELGRLWISTHVPMRGTT